MAVAGNGEVHHVGAGHAVVDDVGALQARALDERCGNGGRRQAHVTRDRDPLRIQIRDERAADQPRAFLVDLGRIQSANVVGLED